MKMLEAECPECRQMVWITSDTRFATYHSAGTPGQDCPGSRTTIPVPPTPAAVRRNERESAKAAALAAKPPRAKPAAKPVTKPVTASAADRTG